MFWNKKDVKTDGADKNAIRSSEYEFCLNRIAEINTKCALLEADVKTFKATVEDLRGKFNKKLIEIRKEANEDQIENDINDKFLGIG